MLGRNEYMMFKEADLAAIKKIVDNFSAIAKKMGVSVTTDCTVSENQETLMITISVDGNAKSLRYTKSIALSWEDTVNKIKAGMLDALTQICAQDAPMDGVTVEKQKDIRSKAIDDFVEKAMPEFTNYDLDHHVICIGEIKGILRNIAEQLKVGEDNEV